MKTGESEILRRLRKHQNIMELWTELEDWLEEWLEDWIPNPQVSGSKPLGGSKVSLAFYLSVVDQMSTRHYWELKDKK